MTGFGADGWTDLRVAARTLDTLSRFQEVSGTGASAQRLTE